MPGRRCAGVAGVTGVRPARLSGTGRIADDLYLMAHNDRTGKPYLQPRAIGLGLAGALLAELTLQGNIRIWPGGIAVADPAPPADELAHSVLGLLVSEHQQHPVRTWLSFLARTAAGDVARRLERSGYLTQDRARRPWRAQRWVPVDSDCAFAPVARVQSALRSPGRVTAAEVTLAGLAAGCGLASRLLPYAPPNAGRCLQAAIEQLDPGLREVIAQTQVAVDSALLAHRV
jgi:Golgi phosphoprotein 3 (GPP34)